MVGKLELTVDTDLNVHVIGGKIDRDTIRELRSQLFNYQLSGRRPKARIIDGHHIERLANLVGMSVRSTYIFNGEQVKVWM